MTRGIESYLVPGAVNLGMREGDAMVCVQEVAGLLRGDERVQDFEKFLGQLMAGELRDLGGEGCEIKLAHARTDAVRTLALAAGRTWGGNGGDGRGRLFFVAGIPVALSSEYLRVIGVVARVCREGRSRAALMQARTPWEFISVLSQAERAV